MKLQLEHHFGWENYEIDAADLPTAAKAAIRQTHDFLTDQNHKMEVDDHRIVVRRVVDADPPKIAPAWAQDSFKAGAVWFSMPFRAVS